MCLSGQPEQNTERSRARLNTTHKASRRWICRIERSTPHSAGALSRDMTGAIRVPARAFSQSPAALQILRPAQPNRKLRFHLAMLPTFRIFGSRFILTNPHANENNRLVNAYDSNRCNRHLLLRRQERDRRTAMDRRSVRRHQGNPLRSAGLRAAAASTERTDLLPE